MTETLLCLLYHFGALILIDLAVLVLRHSAKAVHETNAAILLALESFKMVQNGKIATQCV